MQGMCPTCLLELGLREDSLVVVTGHGAPAAPPPAPEELAPLFPQFEILEILGQGGMGVVYKARQNDLDRLIALKVLPTSLGRDPAFAERFTREAKALASLNHPNLVAVYSFGKAGEHFWFAMEYVDGINLRQRLRAEPVDPTRSLEIVRAICDALAYAHTEGVVHRDIKPENILVDKHGRVKITDFGLAKVLRSNGDKDHLTMTHQAMGTPIYMAPEQLEHPSEVDHRADIFSLGVVFYELLTGELPLGRFPVPSQKIQVDVGFDEVVLKALEKEPDRRYQTAGAVREDMASLGSGAPRKKVKLASYGASHDDAATGSKSKWTGWTLVGLGCFAALLLAGLFFVSVFLFIGDAAMEDGMRHEVIAPPEPMEALEEFDSPLPDAIPAPNRTRPASISDSSVAAVFSVVATELSKEGGHADRAYPLMRVDLDVDVHPRNGSLEGQLVYNRRCESGGALFAREHELQKQVARTTGRESVAIGSSRFKEGSFTGELLIEPTRSLVLNGARDIPSYEFGVRALEEFLEAYGPHWTVKSAEVKSRVPAGIPGSGRTLSLALVDGAPSEEPVPGAEAGLRLERGLQRASELVSQLQSAFGEAVLLKASYSARTKEYSHTDDDGRRQYGFKQTELNLTLFQAND